MAKKYKWSSVLQSVLLITTCAINLIACDGSGGGGGSGVDEFSTVAVTFAMAGRIYDDYSSKSLPSSGFVPRVERSHSGTDVYDAPNLDSLEITIKNILLVHLDDEAGESKSLVTVFDDEDGIVIDMIELVDISRILSTMEIPIGTYEAIFIEAGGVVSRTGNFARSWRTLDRPWQIIANFTVEKNKPMVIRVDFDGSQFFVSTGCRDLNNEDRVGCPSIFTFGHKQNLSTELDSIPVKFRGEIKAVFSDALMLSVDNGSGAHEIFATDETIIELSHLRGVVTPIPIVEIIDFERLLVGDIVEITGIADPDGAITADRIDSARGL